jgi:hypothetical protein
MPGSPSITQPVVLRALQALAADRGGWHTRDAIEQQVIANGETLPRSSLSRGLLELIEQGAVLHRWHYPPGRHRRRVYYLVPPS